MKTLIIRTDKLGDFYQTLPYINALKRNIGKENIDVLISESIHYHFFEKKDIFNNLHKFSQTNLVKKILLVLKLRKISYKYIIILDAKDRSIIISFFLKCLKRVILFDTRKLNFFFRFLFLNNKKNIIIQDNRNETCFNLYNKVLDELNIKINEIDFKIIRYEDMESLNFPGSLSQNIKNYTLLHLDEKWFSSLYINKFSDISPQKEEFLIFIEEFFAKAKQNIIITTGIKYTPLIYELIDKFFTKINTNFYEYSFDNFKAIICLNSSIKELEIISMNSNNIITCHGPLSLFSGFFNINLIDIIEKTQEKWYYRHTSHIKKYNKLYRKNFKELSKEIILTIK